MKPSVFLTGGDGWNWALDNDLALTKKALQEIVTFTSLKKCEIVHSMWWFGLAHLPADLLVGKRIISHVPGEPFRYFQLPEYPHLASKVGLWVTQSRQAQEQFDSIGAPNIRIPYTVDTSVFHPVPANDRALNELRAQWQIPSDAYLIGNFHRDTEGSDLSSPKLVKGPDIFLEIVSGLVQRGHHIHVLLAGPRRHWLRQQLVARSIPFTFVGETVPGDDIFENNLPQTKLNLLYNLIDAYLVSSRSEGGPRSVLETAVSNCKIISTPVGLALDVLEPDAIYTDPTEAVALLEQDITHNVLAKNIAVHDEIAHRYHEPEKVLPLFVELYEEVKKIEPYIPSPTKQLASADAIKNVQQSYTRVYLASKIASASPLKRIWHKWLRPNVRRAKNSWATIRSAAPRRQKSEKGALTVGIWHEFVKPPYGGGNQFMLALRKGLLARGIQVIENRFHPDVDVYLLNSVHFDVQQFLKFAQKHPVRMVQRIDGPIFLIRGYDREKDELGYQLNETFAATTIVQSTWTLQRIHEMEYAPVNPVIIHNASDPEIFHSDGRIPFDPARKIRLISTSWSDNPCKGGPIYKWIEENLNWDRFDYTFVGRASEKFDRINQIAPLPSDELANLLRQHDIYITASQNDPCSNALIEALQCGLPALYLHDGGHPELVGYGGLSFRNKEEILPQLDKLAAHYLMFQRLIQTSRLDDVVDKYLAVLRQATG